MLWEIGLFTQLFFPSLYSVLSYPSLKNVLYAESTEKKATLSVPMPGHCIVSQQIQVILVCHMVRNENSTFLLGATDATGGLKVIPFIQYVSKSSVADLWLKSSGRTPEPSVGAPAIR